jgi:hypothetical protein
MYRQSILSAEFSGRKKSRRTDLPFKIDLENSCLDWGMGRKNLPI